MNTRKRILNVFLACSIMVSILASCGENTGTETTTPKTTTAAPVSDGGTTTAGDGDEPAETTTTAAPEKVKDLGGKSFIVGNWWSNSDDFTPTSSYDDALVAYRTDIQAKNNMTIKEVQLCGWGEMQELATTSIMAGDPAANVFKLEASWAMALFRQGLSYPVSEVTSVNWDDPKWNKLLKEAWNYNGKIYGFADGYEPREGMYWNKRLFEEAGLDPMLPYDLQASGDWTWDKFLELCEKTTRDVDNDGITDTYAITTFSSRTVGAVMYSNNAKYIGRNPDGTFYSALQEPQLLEALNFVRSWEEKGYVLPNPAGANWDYFDSAWREGKAAIRIEGHFAADAFSKEMTDDFGFVFFPCGPSNTSKTLIAAYHENVCMVPSSFSAAEVEDIMFAYDLWTDPVPGYEDADDSWKINQYAIFSDERAVDETLEAMWLGENGVLMYDGYYVSLPGDGGGAIEWNIWNLDKTTAELIEGVLTSWGTAIDEANKLIEEARTKIS